MEWNVYDCLEVNRLAFARSRLEFPLFEGVHRVGIQAFINSARARERLRSLRGWRRLKDAIPKNG